MSQIPPCTSSRILDLRCCLVPVSLPEPQVFEHSVISLQSSYLQSTYKYKKIIFCYKLESFKDFNLYTLVKAIIYYVPGHALSVVHATNREFWLSQYPLKFSSFFLVLVWFFTPVFDPNPQVLEHGVSSLQEFHWQSSRVTIISENNMSYYEKLVPMLLW